MTGQEKTIEVFVFYCDISYVNSGNIKEDSFKKESNQLLEGFYSWKPYTEKERSDRVLDIIKKMPVNKDRLDLKATSESLNIPEKELLNIIAGKYEPYEIPKILVPDKEFDSYADMFYKELENDYLIIAQQWPPEKKLSEDDSQKVIAAIMNWFMEKKSEPGENYRFYLFFHDKHIGVDKQYESDIIFENPQKENYITKIKDLVKNGFKCRVAIEEIVSFKHESNGKTFELLKIIHTVRKSTEIKQKFFFSKRKLTKILHRLLPTAIDCYGISNIDDSEIKAEYIKEAFGSENLNQLKNRLTLLKSNMTAEMESVNADTCLSEEKRQSINDKWGNIFECDKFQDYVEKFKDFSNEIESLD